MCSQSDDGEPSVVLYRSRPTLRANRGIRLTSLGTYLVLSPLAGGSERFIPPSHRLVLSTASTSSVSSGACWTEPGCPAGTPAAGPRIEPRGHPGACPLRRGGCAAA